MRMRSGPRDLAAGAADGPGPGHHGIGLIPPAKPFLRKLSDFERLPSMEGPSPGTGSAHRLCRATGLSCSCIGHIFESSP